MFEDVKKALEEFKVKFPKPDLNLKISEVYDIHEDFKNNKYYPNSHLPGVYLLADEKKKTQYIGMGRTKEGVGKRLGDHWKKDDNGNAVAKSPTSEGIRYLATITVPEDRAFEVPSIEAWLIRKVDPPRNTQGRDTQ